MERQAPGTREGWMEELPQAREKAGGAPGGSSSARLRPKGSTLKSRRLGRREDWKWAG